MSGGISEAPTRPWPTPNRPWIMAQTWHDLLFVHWPFSPEQVRELIPPELPLDTWEGQAWIGVVPFWMSGVRPRGLPSVPWLSTFPELNVRTYVTVDGKPGLFFFSLDAGNWLAVRLARWWVHLPYYHARMSVHPRGDTIAYLSERIHRNAPQAGFVARYQPVGPPRYATPGSLDDWLTTRLCFYFVDRQRHVYRREIDHPAWPLQPSEIEIETNSMLAPLGLQPPEIAPLLHFARRMDVRVWPQERVRDED